MTSRYLIRLDDACPTMDAQKWSRIEIILDQYEVRPMVGIIPYNEDPKQQIDTVDSCFWHKTKFWQEKQWVLALHGYNHCYISSEGGINPIWNRSEFAGLPLEIQKEKIRKGIQILKKQGIEPKYFFAPSHTFDKNTLIALREESKIRIISDTMALKPYKYDDFIFIPQQIGRCRKMTIPGFWTICLHPNDMNDDAFLELEHFLKGNSSNFISFEDIQFNNIDRKTIFSVVLQKCYLLYRKIRKIK